MDVKIVYCMECKQEPRAQDLKESIRREHDIHAELVPGHGGRFTVTVDGEPIYDLVDPTRDPDERLVMKRLGELEEQEQKA